MRFCCFYLLVISFWLLIEGKMRTWRNCKSCGQHLMPVAECPYPKIYYYCNTPAENRQGFRAAIEDISDSPIGKFVTQFGLVSNMCDKYFLKSQSNIFSINIFLGIVQLHSLSIHQRKEYGNMSKGKSKSVSLVFRLHTLHFSSKLATILPCHLQAGLFLFCQ